MSHIQHGEISLGEIVNNIENDSYKIPKFQRNFVWKNTDIESLGDSIVRGYPISSILTMPVNGSLRVSYSSINASVLIQQDTTGSGLYILDGQQRITSIARIFANLDQEKQYFFDLLSILCEGFPDDKLEETDLYRDRPKARRVSDCYCKSFPLGKSGFMDSKYDHQYLSANAVIRGKFSSLIIRFLDTLKNEIPEDKYYEYNDFLGSLFGKVSKHGVSQTRIEENAELGVVCRVFEKVNSTGKKLTVFDLVNAKSFDYQDYTEGLAHKISELLESEKYSKYNEATRSYFEYDFQNNVYTNLARMIRILFVADSISNEQTPQIFNSVMLSHSAGFWFETLDKYIETILEYTNYFYLDGILKFAPRTYFEYMLGILAAKPGAGRKEKYKQAVIRYGLKLSIDAKGFSKSDLDTVLSFSTYASDIQIAHSAEVDFLTSRPSASVSLSNNDFRSSGGNSSRTLAAMYIMTKEKYQGKFTQDIANHNIQYGNSNYQVHHIVPRSLIKFSNDKIYESIANLTPLNTEENQYVIKDKSPLDYFKDLKDIHGEDKFNMLCDLNLINTYTLDKSDDFISFLEERLEKVRKYVDAYFNQ